MRIIESSLFSPYEKALLLNENLSHYAFSLCGGSCSGMFRIEDAEMLTALSRNCIDSAYPFKVLGGMTNILISDDGFDGIILLNRKGRISHRQLSDGSVILTSDSGMGMPGLVRYCVENEISGMEWACGLPGTVGGAVCGNAGAFGTEIKDVFLEADILDDDGTLKKISLDDMNYEYRCSMLKGQNENKTLLKASFLLCKGEKEQIAAKCEENRAVRRKTQPVDENSLGSVFKNPQGESAGKLIQAAGLKGFSIGKATVSMKHANFITTEKGVTSSDYHRLVVHVQLAVLDQFGILLEPEIELFGFGLKS